MSTKLVPGQRVELQANITLADPPKTYAAASLATKPVWTTNDATILAITASPDGQTCDVKATGKTGTATVTCTVGALTPVVTTIVVVADAPDTLAVAVSPPALIT